MARCLSRWRIWAVVLGTLATIVALVPFSYQRSSAAAAPNPVGASGGRPGKVVFHPTRQLAHASNEATMFIAGSGTLTYHNNGPVERSNSVSYAIYWQPPGTYMSPTYQSLINRYFRDIGGSSLYNVASQYYDTGGDVVNASSLGGSWVDTAPYPSSILGGADIQNAVVRAIQANNWPVGNNAEYFVYTAKGENSCLGTSCSFAQYCSWHSYFSYNGSWVYLADMPYAGSNLGACGTATAPNGDPDADSEINLTSHEQLETVTDPFGNAWYDAAGYEIADKCAWNFGPVASSGANVTLNGDPYIVQEEFSDASSSCVLSYSATTVSPTSTVAPSPTPTPGPTASPTASPTPASTPTATATPTTKHGKVGHH